MLKIILWRITLWAASWIIVIVNGIIRDSKENRQKAEDLKLIYGEKRLLLINVYTMLIVPELIVIGLFLEDMKTIFKGDGIK